MKKGKKNNKMINIVSHSSDGEGSGGHVSSVDANDARGVHFDAFSNETGPRYERG